MKQYLLSVEEVHKTIWNICFWFTVSVSLIWKVNLGCRALGIMASKILPQTGVNWTYHDIWLSCSPLFDVLFHLLGTLFFCSFPSQSKYRCKLYVFFWFLFHTQLCMTAMHSIPSIQYFLWGINCKIIQCMNNSSCTTHNKLKQ